MTITTYSRNEVAHLAPLAKLVLRTLASVGAKARTEGTSLPSSLEIVQTSIAHVSELFKVDAGMLKAAVQVIARDHSAA